MGDDFGRVIARLGGPPPPNEAAVRQAFVLPLLRALEWDTEDFEQVAFEYSVQSRSVDVALCHPRGRPQVFIEIEQSTSFEQGVEQLLRYGFDEGVRIAVLTDGQRWSFYLLSGAGRIPDRRFYHLDLAHRDKSEVETYLVRYLAKDRVKSGDAFRTAQEDCDSAARKRQLGEAIPFGWEAMLRDCDEYISFALAERVETLTGLRPGPEAVEEFLRAIGSRAPLNQDGTQRLEDSRQQARRDVPLAAVQSDPRVMPWFSIGPAKEHRRTSIAIVRDALGALDSAHPGFLVSFEASARHGRTRRWIASDRTKLYADRPDLCEECAERVGDWWLGTNYGKSDMRKMLEDVAALCLRRQIDFKFGLGSDR